MAAVVRREAAFRRRHDDELGTVGGRAAREGARSGCCTARPCSRVASRRYLARARHRDVTTCCQGYCTAASRRRDNDTDASRLDSDQTSSVHHANFAHNQLKTCNLSTYRNSFARKHPIFNNVDRQIHVQQQLVAFLVAFSSYFDERFIILYSFMDCINTLC